jgi:hypothetical protein
VIAETEDAVSFRTQEAVTPRVPPLVRILEMLAAIYFDH